jgi:uncharacterized protein involved in type VI secretion and phage assembly
MSLPDKNKNKSSVPDPKDLAKNVADTSGLTDQVHQKVNELTAPVSEALFKASDISDQVTDAVNQAQDTLNQAHDTISGIAGDIPGIDPDMEADAYGFTNFQIIPHEQWLKEKGSVLASYGGDLDSQLKDSHIVYSTIQIAGENVLQDCHFTLSINQKIAEHDSFEITCPSEAFGDKNSYPLTHSKNYLGKRTTIQLKQFGETTYIFTGIITHISNKKIDGYSHIILSGNAPTILLENGQDCQSYENLPLAGIIKAAVGEDYPTDLVQWDIRPSLQQNLLYSVQYRESDWAFIRRTAIRYGEWLYYNGQQIVFGGYGGKIVDLVEEQDVYEFELKMQLVPQKFSYVGYDAKQARNHTVDSDSVSLQQVVNPFQFHALKASEEVFTKVPLSLYNQSLLEKGEMEIKQAVKRQKLNRQNVFFLEAKTNNPNIRLGDIARLKAWMPGHEIFDSGEVPLESYRVIEINHYQDVTVGYYNLIVGVPMDNVVPPYMDEDEIPLCEEQSAIVTDNNDPEGMSRIRVQFPWQKPTGGQSPWFRMTTPYAGKGKGMHVIPEIGEEVVVGFENGNAEKPIGLGAMFNGGGKSGHGGSGNYMKGLQTAAGSNLTFNDQTGSMNLADQGTASMNFDGAGITTIDSRDQITLVCGNSRIDMLKDGTILINGKDIGVLGSTSVVAGVGNKDSVTSGIGIKPSTLDIGSKTLTMSGEEANLGGSKVNIGGGAETNIASGTVKLN